MRTLRDLLATWENWSARSNLTRARDRADAPDLREKLSAAIDEAPEVNPLDALRDTSELVDLLGSWRWQAIYAARRGGACWDTIADAVGMTTEQARADYAASIERQECYGLGDTAAYRGVL